MNEILKDGDTPLFIGYDGELLWVVFLKDVSRDNVKAALDRLKASGAK